MINIYKLINYMKLHANTETKSRFICKIGTVTNYDPATYTAKVLLQPDGIQTNSLPIFSPWVGNGWGLFCPPNVGDVCEVQFQEGNKNNGIICSRGFGSSNRALSPPTGEFWLVHKSGSYFKLLNSGNIEISSDLVGLGNALNSIKSLVTEDFVDFFNTHTHSGDGQPPTQQMSSSQLTHHVKAN